MNEFRLGHFIALLFGVILLGAGSCATFINTESPLAACIFFVAVGAAVGTVMAGLARLASPIKTTVAVGVALVFGGCACYVMSSISGAPGDSDALIVSLVAVLSGIAVIVIGRKMTNTVSKQERRR